MEQERLLVLPNPYTFIDGDGEPQGACPADPTHAGGARMWVGATLDRKRTKHVADYTDRPKLRRGGTDVAWSGDPRPRPQVTKFAFASQPVEIPSTPHYLDRIREGSLIAADADTFAKVHGGPAKYVEPAQALAEARKKAFDEFRAAHGKDPAFAREEAEAAPPAVEAARDGAVDIRELGEQMKRIGAPAQAADAQSKTGDLQPGRDALQDLALHSADTAPTGGTK